MQLKILVCSVVLSAAAPAFAEREVITASGQPEAMFKASLADTVGKLSNTCMSAGWAVVNSTSNQVVCELQMGAFQSALTQMLIGNSYSTPPRAYARFTAAQIGEGASRVQANAWVETQMAFGQMRQQPYGDDNTYNNLLGFLIKSGGELVPGSRFPGIYLGFDGDPVAEGKSVYMPIDKLYPGPGMDAGLKAGDRITKIDGKPFRNAKDYQKKLSKIAIGNRYPLEIWRNGQLMTVTVEARERPVVGTKEWDAMIAGRAGDGAASGPEPAETGGAAGTPNAAAENSNPT